jgi:putative ABC transport system substrate-binding protein
VKLSLGAAAWPLAAGAQQSAIPVIGFLFFGSPPANASAGSPAANLSAEFRRRLKEAGYDESRNIAIEFRWGNNWDRLLELAADLVRRQVAVIVTSGGSATTTSDITAAARAMNRDLTIAEARSASDIESAIATLVQRGNGALIVSPYQLFGTNMNRILGLVARHNIPAIYFNPAWVRRGGLMSYGAKAGTSEKIVADYVVRILQGAKPTNLPVQQPTEFDLVINLKTAKTLGLTVPPTLYALATEVIE